MDNSDQKFESDLIKTVFLFDCIYSKTSPHYGSKGENDSAWLNVARTLLSPMTDCVDRWHFLYQKFIHFSRLETKFGYDLLCSQWGHYQLFKAKQPEMASSYTELIVLKANTRKQLKDSLVRSYLIRHIECMENELLKPNTSCVRRQELWTEISNSLKKRYRLTQRCIMEWQMIWWEVKEELQKFLSTDGKNFNQDHLRLIYLFQVNQIKDPDAQRKLSLNHEFDENVIESTCLNCSSTDSHLKDGLCNTCYEEFSLRCLVCLRVKSTCSLATTGWRYRAKRLLPQSCRNKEYISLCSSCHSNLKERASCIWKVCRVCGDNKYPLENLMHHSFNDAKQIFQTATGCAFRLSDGLPCFICAKCRDDFMDFVRFYVRFSNTQGELQDIQEKRLFGNEGVLRNAVYTNSKTVVQLPPTPCGDPRTYSIRQKLRVEKNKYFARHDRSAGRNASKNEIFIEETESSSDEASQPHPEEGNKNTSEQENLSVPSRTEVSDQSSASITENPMRLLGASGNKRSRTNDEPDDGTSESREEKISRNEERTDCVLVEDDNSEQTNTHTLPHHKRTFSISELSIEDLEDMDFLLNSNDSPSTSGLRASRSGNSNEPECEEYVISDTSSNMSTTESETETAAPADSLVLKPDGTDFSQTSLSESPPEPVQNPSQSLTKQNPSRRNSVSSKTTSNVIPKQLSPRRLTSEQGMLPDLRLSQDISITLIEKQPEQVLIETPPQSQPNNDEVIHLEVLNEKETCQTSSNQNPLLIELLNRQAIEVTTSPITLPLNTQTATSTLPEKVIKVIDIETGSLIKNPVMGSKILGPNIISVTRTLEHSTTPYSNCGTRVTRSTERSEMHVSKPTTKLTSSLEQSAIASSKPCTKVTTSLEPSAVPSSTVTRSSEQAEMHITRVTRSSEQMAVPSPKLYITVSKSSEQSTTSSAKPCTRRTRSWEKSAMTSSKPGTDVPKSDKKLLGEMLINCVLDKTIRPVETEKVNIKRDTKLLGDMLKISALDKPTSSTEAAGVDPEMNKNETREDMLADLNKPAESARIDTAIEVIQSEDEIPDTIRSTARESSSANTSQEIDTIIIRDDSPVNEPSAPQIPDESLEIHSNSFMFLPEIVQSTEMRLHTDIALHKTLLIDDEDDDDGEDVDVHIIEEESCDELNADQVRHLHQSSLIDSVIERSFRTESNFLQIEEVFSLNADDRGVDQDKTSDL